jgi:DNA-binding MltR family transcriptional regulator
MSDLIDKQVEHWIRNLATLQDELEHSTSDRSCVIVAAAYIDELLEYLLKNFLYSPSSEKEDKDLFSGYGPLSSFSSKILLSYRLGLISNYEYKTLQIIRKIRNAFAHDISKGSLLEYKEMLIPFVPARQLLLIKTIPLPSENDTESPLPIIPEVDMSSARDVFQKIVLCLSNLLLSRSLVVVKEKRVIPQDYKSLVEIDDQKICMMQKHLNGLEQLMDLIKEAIELNQQVIKGLIDTSVTQNNKEIEKHKAEIRDLESELEDDKQEYIKMDALLSMTKYAREQIKKAFDKEMLT